MSALQRFDIRNEKQRADALPQRSFFHSAGFLCLSVDFVRRCAKSTNGTSDRKARGQRSFGKPKRRTTGPRGVSTSLRVTHAVALARPLPRATRNFVLREGFRSDSAALNRRRLSRHPFGLRALRLGTDDRNVSNSSDSSGDRRARYRGDHRSCLDEDCERDRSRRDIGERRVSRRHRSRQVVARGSAIARRSLAFALAT